MIFFFRATFWTLVVYAFLPAGFYAPQDGAFARQAEDIAAQALSSDDGGRVTASVETRAVCQDREALCETAGEFVRFAGWAASMAADSAESAFESLAENREPARPASPSADEVFAAAAGEAPAR